MGHDGRVVQVDRLARLFVVQLTLHDAVIAGLGEHRADPVLAGLFHLDTTRCSLSPGLASVHHSWSSSRHLPRPKSLSF